VLPAAREGPLHKGWVYIRKSEAKIHASFVRVAGRAARFARALIGAGKLYSTICPSMGGPACFASGRLTCALAISATRPATCEDRKTGSDQHIDVEP
jgi:hypothetical protein